jgi:Fe-S-cluster formation regulator IscX/YfhJ
MKVMAQMETEDGWVLLGALGKQLANLAPDFDPRTFGFRKLNDVVRETKAFEIEQVDGRHMRVRLKPAERRRSKGTARA